MIRAIISFFASVLTAVQIALVQTQGRGVCFNDGCDIVDSLTAIPPIYFNIAGFLYFQTLFWFFLWGRNGSEYWHKLARLLLLAGLVAEAVLIFFQYKIAMAFCSYCLVVFSLIFLLNLLCGLRQIFRGVVLFSAVMAACFSLDFGGRAEGGASLDGGSIAMVPGSVDGVNRYLFFSSTCIHCENIIDSLRRENSCNLRFNPVDRLGAFQFPNAEHFDKYDPKINKKYLQGIAVTEVPALVVTEAGKTVVLQGKQRILEYLDEHCRPEKKTLDYSGTTSAAPLVNMAFQSKDSSADDACSVSVDCEKDQSRQVSGKQ